MEFPYKAEYAKSGRASCRGCKSAIAKEELRLAVMVQSPMHDGKVPNWYHFICFFGKQKPKNPDDIENLESLRYEDQEKIKEKIKSGGDIVLPTPKGKGKKRNATAENGALKDFTLEYSKSSRAMCRGCEQKIMKDEIRIAKKDYETEMGRKYGGQDMWHHLTCFAKLRSELGYFACGDQLPGFASLKKDAQKEVLTNIPAIKQEDAPEAKKMKKEDEVDGGDDLEKEIKAQNETMYKHRDNLKKNLKKNELKQLLEANEQDIPVGEDVMLDRLADLMTFGRLLPCPECKNGQLAFNKVGYVCEGDLTEWTKCQTVIKEPKRTKFTVPKELAEEFSFLKRYKCKPKVRVFKEARPTAPVKKEETDGKPKVERETPPLYDMIFVIAGESEKKKRQPSAKERITKLGGKVATKMSPDVMAVIATPEQVENIKYKIKTAQEMDIHVVSEDFIDEAKDYKGKIPELVIKKSICDWGADPKTRLPAEPSVSHKSKSKSIYTSKVPSKVTLTLKGGNAVDPDSGLADKAHVYTDRDDNYNAILGITDLQKDKNTYYKIQLLKSDTGSKYWVFRSWGRIGTTIGGTKLEPMATLQLAKTHFMDLYNEKTGNMWAFRDDFMKVPGKMYPIDVDYGNEEQDLQIEDTTPSKLPTEVQQLMKLIFDINNMKKVMLEFELDTEKMPLGKLSKTQMKKAYSVLSELQGLINTQAATARFVDASNRFYTFIPHACGVDKLPVLDNPEIIKQKIEMIDNLMELEIAYNLMKNTSGGNVDAHYGQLKTDIDVLDKSSEEFKIIQEYVTNTHASTHDNYDLEIQQVFKINRQGEEKRFKPFKKLPNRKLLWHGSRITNYAGILSQGLRIAPPEAPVTGYMFGKGIYFADMVSKSANYCCTNVQNSTGLLMLCDVALGNMYERMGAEYIEKLPKGKHSCKGVGSTQPDPKHVKKIGDIEVPLGKGVQNDKLKSSLLYNEFIVYDVAQVNVKYLLQMNFKYKF